MPPGKDGETIVPTVGDFVQLLKKHQYSAHKFAHQCTKNGKELTGWYLDWAKKAASQFQRDATTSDLTAHGAGALTKPLNELFSKLPPEQQEKVLPILDAQARYQDEMHASSRLRLQSVLSTLSSQHPAIAKILSSASTRNTSRASSRAPSPSPSPAATPTSPTTSNKTTDPGPGAYLSRWQDLLDKTPITPSVATGKTRMASSTVDGKESTKVEDGPHKAESAQDDPSAGKLNKVGKLGSEQPDVEIVFDVMGLGFRELLAARSIYW